MIRQNHACTPMRSVLNLVPTDEKAIGRHEGFVNYTAGV
jgi:hypothetical protein